MGRTRRLLENIALLAVSTLITVGLVEAALHFLPPRITGLTRNFPLVADPDLAFLHKGDTLMRIESRCFSAAVSTNSMGFRDSEWEGPQDIVVLGDSYMEGFQVSDGKDFSSVLEKLTGLSVANLGVASYSTVSELFAYEKFGSPLEPKVVILAFYTGNDIAGNDCAYSRGPNGTLKNSCGEVSDGVVIFPKNFYSVSGSHSLRSFVRENCVFCKLVNDTYVSWKFSGEATPAAELLVPYLPHGTDQAYEASWFITESALRQLKNTIARDGAEFVVMVVPEHISTSPTGKQEFMEKHGLDALPENFDPREPQERLASMLASLEIPFLDLADSFIAYQTEHSLQYPYFSFSCDGHWNETGHELAARVVADYLNANLGAEE